MNERRINLDQKQGVRKISITELIARLSRIHLQTLRIADKNDYKCYYMGYENYDENQKNNVFHIGYSRDVHLEGEQFISVCKIEKGKIKNLDFTLNEKTINLGKLYIDNMEGKNIITNEKIEILNEEMPY